MQSIVVLLEEKQVVLGRRVDAFPRASEWLVAENLLAVGFEILKLLFPYIDHRLQRQENSGVSSQS